jgi:Protein of unknown function (DUF2958)
MRLLTERAKAQLPKLYAQEESPDPTVWLHFFSPLGHGDWYITEGQDDGPGRFLMFGLCDLGFPEMGYVTLEEMESIELPGGLGIERDRHWKPRPLSEVRRERGV